MEEEALVAGGAFRPSVSFDYPRLTAYHEVYGSLVEGIMKNLQFFYPMYFCRLLPNSVNQP